MSDYERERLFTLRQLRILDTPPSESFDRITRTASKLFNLPLSAVSLSDADRQWFKSRVGTELTEVPRTKSPCSDISATSEVLVIEDFLAKDFYQDCPQAKLGMRFYAGAPLTTHDGYTLGTLCVLGPEPRKASDEELEGLVDLSHMVMAQIELQYALGRVDPNTLLPNRFQLNEDLADLAKDRADETCHVLFVELGDVRELNTLDRVMGAGHTDELGREATRALRPLLNGEEKLYSVGPCQFLVLCPPMENSSVEDKAQRIHDQLFEINSGSTLNILVRPTLGIAPVQLGRDNLKDTIRHAQSACHDARRDQAAWRVYNPFTDADFQRRFQLVRDIRDALETGEGLRLVYQPRIEIKSGLCIGVEALLRWTHPSLGEISPTEFIPLIENTPLARHVTRWVLDTATQQAALWFHQGRHLRVSANVMACNFEEEAFTERLIKRMQELRLPPSVFELELTESALARNQELLERQLRMLTTTGIHLAIDDFGTGYSSLSYLLNIPAKVIKIDRTFTVRADRSLHASQDTLLKAMIDLAHGMGFRTVAEGYEPSEMLQTLSLFGCDEVQSFAISRPLSPAELERWLDDAEWNGPFSGLSSY
ncbi:EAL domain-containing protein [Marinobacter nanhaiticus D15-8W]|uniref:Sensor domain-containing phosphodiesterase n=1 Tax=Marinobacter nanhaiticus D15-8W TaxID=626887 RepID=N6WVE1_9GAMM|nr:sensor domain-containing phosphodiesterase [Marinobacter nanhaiticus]ENO12798.1 sensor domain-containing phosphodiesterase [Marinobacter nanhaiticus D15-8W]BES70146.1 EAL domain-containing protein [Marinobacter nanhaiticus D15-8W]